MDTLYKKEFEFWGMNWETCMEGSRPIHPLDPRYCIHKSNVIVDKRLKMITLNMKYDPIIINWYGPNWSQKRDYKIDYTCGLIKTKNPIPINSIIEVDLKFPKGANIWSSFLLTACDSWPPEIDIVGACTDNKGSYKNKLSFHTQWPFIYKDYKLETNIHYRNQKNNPDEIGCMGINPKNLNLPLEENWNHFKCIWSEDMVEIHVNDKLVRKITNEYILSKLKTKGMWAIFSILPNKLYNDKPIKNTHNFYIKNFKVKQIDK
jgi:hypothetical protein